jgi:two-component system sensor histidine kinase KdpD
LILAGGGALAALWLLTLLGARLLVRPVRDLTRAAEQMASGDLEQRVSVSEGGEIGVLAESLEAMRAQLMDSLETVRRWGGELELKVAHRTAELNARNQQLAAVSAILAAANETHDLEGMLRRCLDVVLEQTRADGAAVQLLADGRPAETVAAGTWVDFPCAACTERSCLAAAGGEPVYLAPYADERRHPGCTVGGESLAVLPLRGPSGVLGILTLGRRDGELPTPEERTILSAICDQIAVAVENTRLAAELRRLEARHEVQRLRSELISAVSHELRTPLGFIKSYATTMLREDMPIDPATRRHFLEIIDEETDKLEQMIDELLDASRLQAGRLQIERQPFALEDLISRTVEKMRPTLAASGHAIMLELPGGEVRVFVDPLRIEQVLDNLLENAGRYSEPASPVEVSLLVEDGHAVISVTDRGDGLTSAELEQIFEPFYRGRNAKRSGIRGAGLGLAICRGIVEAHGGRIWAESGHDRTTTFALTLPLAESAG